jgi:hypothetical protein
MCYVYQRNLFTKAYEVSFHGLPEGLDHWRTSYRISLVLFNSSATSRVLGKSVGVFYLFLWLEVALNLLAEPRSTLDLWFLEAADANQRHSALWNCLSDSAAVTVNLTRHTVWVSNEVSPSCVVRLRLQVGNTSSLRTGFPKLILSFAIFRWRPTLRSMYISRWQQETAQV